MLLRTAEEVWVAEPGFFLHKKLLPFVVRINERPQFLVYWILTSDLAMLNLLVQELQLRSDILFNHLRQFLFETFLHNVILSAKPFQAFIQILVLVNH